MRARTMFAVSLLLTTSHLIGKAGEPTDKAASPDETSRIVEFFERSTDQEPAVLGRILRSEAKDERTPGGVSIDGTSVLVYHTLERTPDGIRLKTSTVHDTIITDLDGNGERISPGRSGYRIEVAEIELHRVEGASRVHGYLRNISNSRFDPVGWSVEISDARVEGQDEKNRGVLILDTREVGSGGTYAKGGRFDATTWKGVTRLELDEGGRVICTFTTTDYSVDPETGTREKIEANPEKNIVNPDVNVFREISP